ncbi:MAG: thiamine pyrophosphate-dependent enzyme [Spirochaetota bacterium]|nr:thiamine pyrophosphate-dependent enzyme [Spirochaetota bacterium]
MSKTESKKVLCERPVSRMDVESMLCPGCQHGIIGRIVCEVIDELGIQGDVVSIAGVGCHAMMLFNMNVDCVQALHGRAPGVGTGVKRGLNHEKIVFTIQGDGDLASIGAGDIVNAASRGEKLTIIFCNNSAYGTTGGQMAPTTLLGQKTTTSPEGRDKNITGYPLHVAELMATFPGVAYSARCALTSMSDFIKTKKSVKTAFQKQIDGIGLSIVEILSACPPSMKLSPIKSIEWIKEHMINEFPLGEFKNIDTPCEGYSLKTN